MRSFFIHTVMKTKLIAKVCLFLVLFGGCKNSEKESKLSSNLLQPFVINHRAATYSSIDISFLLEKPAGRNGFITVKDGRLVKPDGSRMRFWGVNITDWTRGSVQIPTKEEASFWAQTLSRHGINCVRLTFLDFFSPRGLIDPTRTDTRKLDPVTLDKLDYWISELKRNGIYTDLNLLVGRTYKEDDGLNQYNEVGWAKYVSYFDPQLIKLQKEFAQQLLTHYNPYTKSEYRNEPAICIVELVNENTLFDAWYRDALHPSEKQNQDVNFRNLTPYHSDMLTKLYNDYLKKTYSYQEVDRIRQQSGASENEMISRPQRKQYKTAGKEWFQSTISFYQEVEKGFFIEMRRYMKDTLQVKSLLLGSNDFLHNQSEYPMLSSNKELDIIDGHVYWQHPSWPGKINTPMVNEPDSSTVAKLSRTALAAMPYTVTEVNNAFPSDYDCEAIPVMAAYSSFQDWDGVMFYTFEMKLSPEYKGYVGDAFDISHHPVKMPQMIAGSLMYLRGDVKQAQQTVERNYTQEEIRETMRMPMSEYSYYTPGYPTSNVFKHKVRIGSLEKPEEKLFKPVKENPIESDTKELNWYTKLKDKGLVTVNTPYSQALIGFVKANNKSLSNLSVHIQNDFCSITLSSLDQNPISQASKLLLITGAKVENSGQIWNETRTKITEKGNAPSLIEVVSGEITLTNLENATQVFVTPLDGSGNPFANPITAVKSNDNWKFTVGRDVTTWYSIEVQH